MLLISNLFFPENAPRPSDFYDFGSHSPPRPLRRKEITYRFLLDPPEWAAAAAADDDKNKEVGYRRLIE